MKTTPFVRAMRATATCAWMTACAQTALPPPGAPDPGAPVPPDELVTRAATATCEALFRCCPSDAELAWYFLPVSTRDPSGDNANLIARVPPNAPLDASTCPAVVGDVLTRIGVGPWLEAVASGRVAYVEDAARACLDQLDSAMCGAPMQQALLDSTCFGLAAPEGGAVQRSFVSRTATSGACNAVVDGFGGLFYGSCDPQVAFCCIRDDQGRCGFSREGAEGTCEPVSREGETCSLLEPTQLCATGVECIVDGERDACAAPLTTPLANGDACWDDEHLRLLGECEHGRCDVFGAAAVCVPWVEEGAPCEQADECRSGICGGGACEPDTMCDGR